MKKGLLISCLLGLALVATAFVALFFVQKDVDGKFSGIDATYSLCEGAVLPVSINRDDLIKATVDNKSPEVAYINENGEIVAVSAGKAVVSISYLLFDYSTDITVTEHSGTIVDCDEPFICDLCGVSSIPKQEHEFSELTCEEDSVCKLCGHVKEKAVGHMYIKTTCEQDGECSVCGFVREKAYGHSWNEATCQRAKTCRRCFKVEGKPVDHKFSDPTCTLDSACIWCDEPGEEKATGHSFLDATCVLASTCERCGETKGKPLGHKPGKEVCGQPSVCTRCEEVLSEALEHKWNEATCTKPKTCSRCKLTEGQALGHKVVAATCETASSCSVCGAYLSNALGHDYVVTADTADYTAYVCTRCGANYQQKKVNVSSYANEVLAILNAERAAVGLSPLTINPTLQSIAQVRAEEIKTLFSHTRPNGQSWSSLLGEYGYGYSYAGENIAAGYRTPADVMTGWMNSSGHRANILNGNYNQIGIGIYNDNGYIYWSQNFSN